MNNQIQAPAALNPWNNLGTHWTGDLVEPIIGPDISEKRKLSSPTGIRTPDRPAHSIVTVPTTLAQVNIFPEHDGFFHTYHCSVLPYYSISVQFRFVSNTLNTEFQFLWTQHCMASRRSRWNANSQVLFQTTFKYLLIKKQVCCKVQ